MHIGYNIFKFPADDDGLYLAKRDDNVLVKWLKRKKILRFKPPGKARMVLENSIYKRSLVASKFYQMVGVPTLQIFNMMIRQNIIQNFPVTVEGIGIAENIFDLDVSTLKVRTTRQRPKVVVNYCIAIQKELIENNQDLILCMDIFSSINSHCSQKL